MFNIYVFICITFLALCFIFLPLTIFYSCPFCSFSEKRALRFINLSTLEFIFANFIYSFLKDDSLTEGVKIDSGELKVGQKFFDIIMVCSHPKGHSM